MRSFRIGKPSFRMGVAAVGVACIAAALIVISGPAFAGGSAATQSAPGAPTGVHASVKAGKAHVSWKPPHSNGGSPITGYEVVAHRPSGNKVGTCTTSASTHQCDIKGPFSVTTVYTFKVVAINAVGRSKPGVGYSVLEVGQSPLAGSGAPVAG